MTVASVGIRLPIAISNADVTKVEVGDESIDQPNQPAIQVDTTSGLDQLFGWQDTLFVEEYSERAQIGDGSRPVGW